jgi:hypothetical protein
MSLRQLVDELKTDQAAWATVEQAEQEVKQRRAERQRLQRMMEAELARECEAITRLTLALSVIKQRQQEGPT